MPSRSSRGSSTTIAIRRTFAGLFGLTPPVVPWPRIGFADAETEVALPMVCSACDGRVVLDARSRSLQLAFLIPIVDAYHDSKVAIRALHYLYYLVVARKHGVHVFELSQELLPQLFRPQIVLAWLVLECSVSTKRVNEHVRFQGKTRQSLYGSSPS